MTGKPKCENEVCKQDALLKIDGVLCCGNHTNWAARRGLERSKGEEVKLAWAAEESA